MFASFILIGLVLSFAIWWRRINPSELSQEQRRMWFEHKVVWVTGASSGIGEGVYSLPLVCLPSYFVHALLITLLLFFIFSSPPSYSTRPGAHISGCQGHS